MPARSAISRVPCLARLRSSAETPSLFLFILSAALGTEVKVDSSSGPTLLPSGTGSVLNLIKIPGAFRPRGEVCPPLRRQKSFFTPPPLSHLHLSSQLLAPPGHVLHLELHRTGNLDNYGKHDTRRLLCSLTPLTPQVFS